MAITNHSNSDGKHETLAELFCTTELTGEIHNHLICISMINSFLSITAFLGNTMILVALHTESSLHAPSKLLFRTLATTDLCVGLIVEPLTVTSWMSAVNKRWNICRYTAVTSFFLAYILCSVSLLTLTTISADRLLALSLGLRYRQIVTLKRTYVIVTVFWILSTLGTAAYFLNYVFTLRYGYAVISLCLVTSGFSYGKIFFILRRNQMQVQKNFHQGQPNQTAALNIAQYRKTVSSALWVQLALVVCYLPHGIVLALISQRGLSYSLLLARGFTVTLVYLNSSLNPILYCWKIREVKQAVKNTIRQLCCSCI